MLNRIRDLAIEAKGSRDITRNIREAIENGDEEAIEAFTSGTGVLRGMTLDGMVVRGEEIARYGELVAAKDGNGARVRHICRSR